MELAIKNKQSQQEKEIEELFHMQYWGYKNVFHKKEATELLPHRQGVDLEINLEEGAGLPIKKIYSLGALELEELHSYIELNKKRGWIRKSFIDRGSPIKFVKMKDGKLRVYVDYWALNHVAKKDRYPVPLIGDAQDRLQDAKYFTKLDIKYAYHNVRIREGDELKTTFILKLGKYEYRVMPFRLCNAPATFQRWINWTLHRSIDISYIVYLYNVLIYSPDKQQHEKDVKNILEAILRSGMNIKPSKYEFHTMKTEYLGFIINQEGIKVDPVKTAAIWDWTKPTKITEVQKFLGLCNFYQRFIQGFGSMARQQYNLTKKANR